MKHIVMLVLLVGCTRVYETCPPGSHDEPDAAVAIAPVCGDQTCSDGETVATCAADCSVCGDGTCTGPETLASCVADCSSCGDGMCTGPETLASCAADCSVCGDAMCTGGETSSTCAMDCAAALKVQNNSSYTIVHLYVRQCVDSVWGVDKLGSSTLPPNYNYTLTGIPPGCYFFRAEATATSVYWTSPQGVTLTPGQVYTWTLSN